MQTAWTHGLFAGPDGRAVWAFDGAVPADSAYLAQAFTFEAGIDYSIRILGEIRPVTPKFVTGMDFDIILYTNNGVTRTEAGRITGAGFTNSANVALDQTINFTATAGVELEVYIQVTGVGADSKVDFTVSSVSVAKELVYSDSKCIGVIRSAKDDIHYLFFYNPNPDKNCIVKVDGDVVSNVITWSGLGFSPDKSRRINGGGIAGDSLYFTDASEPKCVHLTDYVSTPPVSEEEILLIKRGPHLAPIFHKFTTGPSSEPLSQSLLNDLSFQFAYHYEYKDKQVSVLSPYSTLCSKSTKNEDYRRVRISIPAGEQIPERVERVIFSARVGNNGPWFEIARIDTPVSDRFIDFYNNTNGNLLDPFQNLSSSLVPRRCKSMAIAKSRLWVGGNLEGYNAPENINLSFSTIESTPAGPQNFGIYKIKWRLWIYLYDLFSNYSGWTFSDIYLTGPTSSQFFVYTGTNFTTRNGVAYSVAYDPMVNETLDTIPPSQSIPPDQPRPIYSIIDSSTWGYSEYFLEYQGEDRLVNLITAQAGEKTFPSNSSYKGGIVFSDGKGRKSGVYTDDSMVVNTTTDKTDQIKIKWDLANSIGIPDWAGYYSIVMTKNLKKSIFIEDSCLNVEYYRVDESGNDDFDYIYNARFPFVRVNIANLVNTGLGYSFVLGDRIFIRDINGGDQDLEITGFDGTYITARLNESLGLLTALQEFYYEIYRPITSSGAGLLFYETASVYPIVGGEFSTLTGFIEGDSINVSRPLFVLSGSPLKITPSGSSRIYAAMSVDDNSVWTTSIGRPFIETPIGEVDKVAYFRHSGTFIAGTSLNSLSDFDSGDEANIPIESGSVMKLQPTDKEATEGDIVLAISESDTFSVYIDESRISAGTSSFLVGATKVIGDVRKQKSGYGTLHPESVFEYDGYVYFFDKLSRSFCRYATNGIYPISENKTVRYFEDQAGLNSATDVVVSGFDPFYKVVFVTFTNAGSTIKKTIGYSLIKERWVGFFNFAPDLYFSGSKALYSVKSGVIYAHDSTTYNVFYGPIYGSAVEGSFNDGASNLKEWRVMSLGVSPNLYAFSGGDQAVNNGALYLSMSNENGQATNILSSEFEVDENVVYSEIKGDINSGGILNGLDIYSQTLQFRLNMASTQLAYLMWIKAGAEISRGHTL